jgi:hypothetical protein
MDILRPFRDEVHEVVKARDHIESHKQGALPAMICRAWPSKRPLTERLSNLPRNQLKGFALLSSSEIIMQSTLGHESCVCHEKKISQTNSSKDIIESSALSKRRTEERASTFEYPYEKCVAISRMR